MIGTRFKCALVVAMLFGLSAEPAFAAPVKILVLGTSLTQGFGLPPGTEIPALLQARLKSTGIDARVINAGVSGDTSAGGLSRLGWGPGRPPPGAILGTRL